MRLGVPAGMRERFLARTVREGWRIQAGPPLVIAPHTDESETLRQPPESPQRSIWPGKTIGSLRTSYLWAVAGLTCVACFVLGLHMQSLSGLPSLESSRGSRLEAPSSEVTPPSEVVNADSERVHVLTAERYQLARQIAYLAQQLETVQKEKEQTETAFEQQLAAVQSDAARDHNALAQQSAALSARAADLQSRLDTVRQRQSLADADLRNAKARTAEYSARLDLLQTQMRDQEAAPLSDPGEVSSLVAARNLHIIDVYDSNANGKRGRAFGRVFYVEGRSLVLYAYDLTVAQAQKNITFHLWGEKAGSKETTLSLGILHDDDPRERRWVLTCNDPTLLAQINSVFVTAESASKQSDRPRGTKLLYAYFGSPPEPSLVSRLNFDDRNSR